VRVLVVEGAAERQTTDERRRTTDLRRDIGGEVDRNIGRALLHEQRALVQEICNHLIVSRITCAGAQSSKG
jgi:hypothetical protein